jgi:hypothetical protein
MLTMIAAGVLYFAFPANETEADGPADPILNARRDALGVLRKIGLVRKRFFLEHDPWLPSAYGSRWMDEEKRVTARVSRVSEPVYRGLFWRVGERVSVRMEEFREPYRDMRVLRLGYVADGRRFIAGESRFEAGARAFEVTGFVPAGTEGYFAEEVDAAGETRILCSLGTAELARVLGQDW